MLDLSDTRLKELPASLDLEQLVLNLSGNRLTELPESLGQLGQLQLLNLSGNRLTELPESLGNLGQLRLLDLSNNGLTELPEWLGNLAQLQFLHLSGNLLVELPESLGNLGQLQSLDLSHNGLTELPEWLGNLAQLQSLYLSGNCLMELTESLGGCERLESLFLHGNEALGIPPEVLGPEWGETELSPKGKKDSADPRAILAWYFQSRSEPRRSLNEAKMLLVGQGGVGKTSLVHYLIHKKPCNPEELPTEGISIDDWDIQGKKGAQTASSSGLTSMSGTSAARRSCMPRTSSF